MVHTHVQLKEILLLFRCDLIICSQSQIMNLHTLAQIHALHKHKAGCHNVSVVKHKPSAAIIKNILDE